MSRRPRRLETSKATCAAPLGEAPSLRRGRRPHHAGTERVGTWETSGRPQPPWRSRVWAGSSIERSRSGRPEGSDGCVVPTKPRTMPIRIGGGDGGGKAAGRREGEPRRMPRTQCRNRHVPEAASLRTGTEGAAQAPAPRSRSTSDRSPVRESRTPGSARGAGREARPYRDQLADEAARNQEETGGLE